MEKITAEDVAKAMINKARFNGPRTIFNNIPFDKIFKDESDIQDLIIFLSKVFKITKKSFNYWKKKTYQILNRFRGKNLTLYDVIEQTVNALNQKKD